MAENVKEPPLVSFIMLTYNQRDYVEDALAHAVAQTYRPLEIIVSDDQSDDGTFELIKRFAASYEGGVHIHARQSTHRAGLLNHLLEAAALAKGTVSVLAAGDDLSHAQRVERIAAVQRETGASLLSSRFDLIDENGRSLGTRKRVPRRNQYTDWFLPRTVAMFHGATSACLTSFLTSLPRSEAPIYNDDAVMLFACEANGYRHHFIDESLVSYRVSPGALSNSRLDLSSKKKILDFEDRLEFIARCHVALADYCLRLGESIGIEDSVSAALKRDRAYYAGIIACRQRGFLRRLRLLISPEPRLRRHVVTRIFGEEFLATAKWRLAPLRKAGREQTITMDD